MGFSECDEGKPRRELFWAQYDTGWQSHINTIWKKSIPQPSSTDVI
jgi:hypothetical protein